MKKIGTITIGQSPRVDIIPELQALLGLEGEIIEKGALDGLTSEEVARLAPQSSRDEVLVTRLVDGTSVTIADREVFPRVQQRIQELEQEVSVILLLCTGSFPPLTAKVPLLVPEPLLFHFVRGIAYNKPGFKLGVLTPSPDQIGYQLRRWQNNVPAVVAREASPYEKIENVVETGVALAEQEQVDALLLDCMGYTQEMKRLIREQVSCPVILSRAVLARFAAELA